MKVFISGVSCVGKTTIGGLVAQKMGYVFYNMDDEVEAHFKKPIEFVQIDCDDSMDLYRKKYAEVMQGILNRNEPDVVFALSPSGFMRYSWRVIKKQPDAVTVVLRDRAINILRRAVFYDENSQPYEFEISDSEWHAYLRHTQLDMEYFGRSYTKADLKVNINGRNAEESAELLVSLLRQREAR